MQAEVTILICTRNRSTTLRRTLGAVQAIVPRTGEPALQLVVVDNGSTDGTAQVVAEFAGQVPFTVRYLFEPRPGKCGALNGALRQIGSKVILFTDDDVIPRPGWIERMTQPIIEGRADAVAGTVIIPDGLKRRLPHSEAWLASTRGIDFDKPDRMVGANMAIGRHVLGKVPGFDEKLGPGALGFADESLFSFQLTAAGYRLLGVPEAMVEHHFDPARLTRRAMLDAARKMGASEAYVAYHWRHDEAKVPSAAYAWIRLFLCRASKPWLLFQSSVPGASELYWEFARSFSRAMDRERGEPKHYEKLGFKRVIPAS